LEFPEGWEVLEKNPSMDIFWKYTIDENKPIHSAFSSKAGHLSIYKMNVL